MAKQSHYPSYDVMTEKDHWDDHTQSIVTARLLREYEYRFLTLVEAEVLRSWCSQLMGDNRADIIQYVLCHIDESLYSDAGEGQRKPGVPPAPQLIRDGVAAIDATAQRLYTNHFFHLNDNEQQQIMSDVSGGTAILPEIWGTVPQKELFVKLLTLTVEAYYSHPTVWSEIGYGGPAYPRGYVRTQGGHLDPWEAKRES